MSGTILPYLLYLFKYLICCNDLESTRKENEMEDKKESSELSDAKNDLADNKGAAPNQQKDEESSVEPGPTPMNVPVYCIETWNGA